MSRMIRRTEIALVYGAGLVQGLALVTFPAASDVFTSPSFPVGTPGLAYGSLLFATSALGLGFGAALTALNALAAGYFPGRSERAVTALHALLGTGTAALAPLLVALVTGLGAWWALPVAVAAVLGVLVALGTRLTLDPSAGAKSEGGRQDVGLLAAARILGLFAVAGIVYGMVETIYANWAVIYLQEDAGVSVRDARYALTAFWAMVTVGRLAVATIGGWLSPPRIYPLLPGLMVVAFLWIAMVDGAAAGIGAFALAGLACSAFLPLTIGFAEACHRDLSEIVSGGMIAAYMLGFGIGSFGLRRLRDAAGIPLSVLYGSSSVLAIVLGGMALVLTRRRRAVPAAS